MRVLMFGWEFPPHIAGGLGTACYGMTQGLARNDVEVIFVMPKASGDDIYAINRQTHSIYGELWSSALCAQNLSRLKVFGCFVKYLCHRGHKFEF